MLLDIRGGDSSKAAELLAWQVMVIERKLGNVLTGLLVNWRSNRAPTTEVKQWRPVEVSDSHYTDIHPGVNPPALPNQDSACHDNDSYYFWTVNCAAKRLRCIHCKAVETFFYLWLQGHTLLLH